VADLAIGRLNANSLADTTAYLNKLIAYENAATSADWTERMQIVNDKYNNMASPGEELAFIHLMDWFHENVPNQYDVDHINLLEVSGTAAKQALELNLEEGQAFTLFTGHSQTSGITSEQIWTNSTFSSLNNSNPAFPFVALMTCLTGAYTSIFETSFGETIVGAQDKGAIAAFVSSGMTFPNPQDQLARALFTHIFDQSSSRIGDLILSARTDVATLGFPEFVANSYNLLGDPSLGLIGFPDGTASASTPNAAAPDGAVDSLGNEPESSNDGGGCSTVHATSNNLAAMILLLFSILLLKRHRRRVRVRIRCQPNHHC
jgi:hypothetical protein